MRNNKPRALRHKITTRKIVLLLQCRSDNNTRIRQRNVFLRRDGRVRTHAGRYDRTGANYYPVQAAAAAAASYLLARRTVSGHTARRVCVRGINVLRFFFLLQYPRVRHDRTTTLVRRAVRLYNHMTAGVLHVAPPTVYLRDVTCVQNVTYIGFSAAAGFIPVYSARARNNNIYCSILLLRH